MGKKKKNSYNKNRNNINNSNKTNTTIDNDTVIEEKIDETVKEEKTINDEEISNTNVNLYSKDEMYDLEKKFKEEHMVKLKPKKHLFVNFFSVILLIAAIAFFALTIINKSLSLYSTLTNLLLTLFSILFVGISFSYNRKNRSIIFFSTLLLLGLFALNLNLFDNTVSSTGISKKNDFRGKDLTEVVKWTSKNKVKLNQEYEYSDMVPEYEIISQDIKTDDSGKIYEITVSVSEGPNPSKEVIIPSMTSWDSERVLKFIKDNYLSNVNVEFVESDKAKDTVIEQSTSGNLKRDEELNLTFSYGEELGFDEVTLIDFTNMSKFETEFYMKKNQLRYEFEDDFSKDIKKGNVVSQSIEAGKTVKVNDERIKITVSKGPEIKVPDLKGYSVTEITEWAIKNKLKLNFSDKYDDSIKENNVISCNYETDSIIEQGTVIKVVLSRGPLKMPKFKSLNDFYSWADKYEIKYEEKHEFNNSVDAGEVISYSYKTGEAIKNDDTIIVTISDGKKREVPNLKGLTKKEAINKLEKVGLNYSFVYKNSVEDKDIVLKQSISAGSEVSTGITVTVTLSNGKAESNDTKEVEKRETSNNNQNNNNNNSNNNNNNSNSNNNSNNNNNEVKPEPSNEPEPTPTCTPYTIRKSHISSTVANYSTCSAAASGLKAFLESQFPGLKVSVNCEEKDGYNTNDFISGKLNTDSCSSITITLAK